MSCASAMLTIMTSNIIRASRGAGVTNAYAMGRTTCTISFRKSELPEGTPFGTRYSNDETLFPPDLPVRRSHSSVHGSREGANFLYDVCVEEGEKKKR